MDMFRTHAPDSRAEDLAEGVVVVRHEVTYVSSLTFGFEPVSIECWVTEIRAASFTMAYEVFEEDEAGERTVFLRARTVLTPYVFATERPRRLHAEERESLGRLLEPDEPVRPPADAPGRRRAGRALPGARPLQRRRRLRPRQQREVLRVLPGGAHPAHGRAAAASSARATTSSSRRPTSTTGARSSSAPSPTTARPGSRTSAARRWCSSPSSATATTCWPARRWSACASTARPDARRRCPRSSATWSGPSLHRVDHELGRVGHVVPEPARPAPR